MQETIKKTLKRFFPSWLLSVVWKISFVAKYLYTRFRFLTAGRRVVLLDLDSLDRLHKQYPLIYVASEWDERQEEMFIRANRLFSFLPAGAKVQSILETGAGDGHLSLILNRYFHKDVTAIDLYRKYKPQMEGEPLDFRLMDCSDMTFADNTFDCVISFYAFEHFLQPRKALLEMLRVTRRGGFVFLDFGPLYYSPFGWHRFGTSVPYTPFLFDHDLVDEYIREHNLVSVSPMMILNHWKVKQYSALWKGVSGQARIVRYEREKTTQYLSFVRQYPGNFAAQTRDFQDLIVKTIRILFCKK